MAGRGVMKSRERAACILCGRRRRVQGNHPGGKKHVAWFIMPLCEIHHDQFLEVLRNIGVDLRYTPNELERLNRASQAIIVCQWLIAEAVKKAISKKLD